MADVLCAGLSSEVAKWHGVERTVRLIGRDEDQTNGTSRIPVLYEAAWHMSVMGPGDRREHGKRG